MRLYLIRHPAPLLPTSVCYGATDIAVAPEELGRVLATLAVSGSGDAVTGATIAASGSTAPGADPAIETRALDHMETRRISLTPGTNHVQARGISLVPDRSVLRARLPAGLPLYSSPLQRCRCLAEPLAAALGATSLTFDERLVEMNFGDWELKSWDEIARSEIDAWTADLVAYRPGAGETVLEMAHRVQAFHTQILAAQQDAIVVCHAGTIRMLLACQRYDSPQDIALHAASTTMKLAYGEPVVMECA